MTGIGNSPSASRVASMAVVLLVGLVLYASTAQASWKPAKPAAGTQRFRLVPESADTAPTQKQSKASYVVLPAGQQVVYRVHGQGRVRIKMRPAFDSPRDDAFFRVGVCFNDTNCRKFKRRSRPDESFNLIPAGSTVPTSATARLLGMENVLELDVSDGTRTITVENRNRDGREIFLRILLEGELTQPRAAKTSRKTTKASKRKGGSKVVVQVDAAQLGFDSNAYMAPVDDNNNQTEIFWPARAEVAFKNRTSLPIELGAKYAFKSRIYQKSILNEYRHRFDVVQKWEASDGLTLSLEEGLAYKQSTFFGRGEESELEAVTADGDTLSLGDRFNNYSVSLNPSVDWELTEDLVVTGWFTWKMRDYVEDYVSYPSKYSLDQDSMEFGLELEYDVTPDLSFTGVVRRTDKQYDEKFSRDEFGIEVETVAANYVKDSGSLGVDWGKRYGLRLGGEIKFFQSTDQYQGYWDYSGLAVEGSGGWRWETGHRFELKVRHSESDHDRSHVLNDVAEPLRSKTVLNVRAGGQVRLNSRWELVGSLHYKDYDYNSRTFAYTRALVQAGMMYEF